MGVRETMQLFGICGGEGWNLLSSCVLVPIRWTSGNFPLAQLISGLFL